MKYDPDVNLTLALLHLIPKQTILIPYVLYAEHLSASTMQAHYVLFYAPLLDNQMFLHLAWK